MLSGIVIGILIYSLILSAITIYKDNSSYFIVEPLDIIIAGPFLWVLMGILYIIRPFYRRFHREKKPAQYKTKSDKYIKKVVSRIVRKYKTQRYHDDIFDFTMICGEYNCNDIEGWTALLVKQASNEHLNRKFEALMWGPDKDRTIAELKTYAIPVTEQYMNEHNFDKWFIQTVKGKDVYIFVK